MLGPSALSREILATALFENVPCVSKPRTLYGQIQSSPCHWVLFVSPLKTRVYLPWIPANLKSAEYVVSLEAATPLISIHNKEPHNMIKNNSKQYPKSLIKSKINVLLTFSSPLIIKCLKQ